MYRKGDRNDFLRIIPELQKSVFGCWKIKPIITVKEDDWWLYDETPASDTVVFDISYPEQEQKPVYESCELMDEIVNLVSAFLDGYILGQTK